MVTYVCRVGRLVEVRFGPPLTVRDIEEMGRSSRALMFQRSERLVCAVDMRELSGLSADVTHALLGNLQTMNSRIERAAVLLPDGSPALAQRVDDLHREAGNPARKTFRASSEVVRFLAETLDAQERARLVAFFDEGLVRRRSSGMIAAVTPPAIGRPRGR